MLQPDFVTKKNDLTDQFGDFTLTPLPRGFGHSLGNAFRRFLLSSVEGAALTHVKITDVVHPFSTLNGVKESALDIILNLKGLKFKTVGTGPFTMTAAKKGKGMITGKDFDGGNIEVVNKDLPIVELTTDAAKVEIQLTVDRGYGYQTADEKEKKEFGVLAMDSAFSPVVKVTYKVQDERVGRKSDFDSLNLQVWTDGSISPETAMKQAAESLAGYFGHVLSGRDDASEETAASASASNDRRIDEKVYEIIIDELDLPTRVINALLREKIETVADLMEKGEEALVNLKGVGRKSVTLIESELEKLGVSLTQE